MVGAMCVAVLAVACVRTAGPATTAAVSIRAVAFEPATVTIRAGGEVTWENADGFDHTITAGVPVSGTFDEPLMAGASTTLSFDRPGTFPYFCRIHPANMRGEVRATEEEA